MAASTSTSTAADSHNTKRFGVFINHRGPDVKNTFASHLYRRLYSYGLQVFLDREELQKGENLTCQIQNAIRTACVHVAAFSPGYADSNWCLEELVLMLESNAPIIPVFYKVKPAALRWAEGNGEYAESLRNLKGKRAHDSQPRYNSKMIENWRKALSRVADITGFELDAFKGDEGELLESVVEAVLKRCPKKLDVARYPTGLDEMVEDFERKVSLEQRSGTVQFVGIIGLGGAGKTTLAKELFNRKSKSLKYSKSCFLVDVREKAKNNSLPSLQKTLLKELSSFNEPIDNKDDGIEKLKKCLSVLSSPVLVVLDDVDHQDQVYALLPQGMSLLPVDSLILITSRDKSVLSRLGVQEPSIYKLTGLNEEHSTELFCSHAFCSPQPLPGFEDLVHKFVSACHGLPLSLKVFGAHLCGTTDISVWEKELVKLQRRLHSEIQERLQISFDALDEEEQYIFVDIACFFIGEKRDTAISVWDGSGWSGSLGFRSLLNKCLVEVDTVKRDRWNHEVYDIIRMHDHLRDMGRDLAKRLLHLRSWETKGHDNLLQQSPVGTEVRGLQIYDEGENDDLSSYKIRKLQLLDSEGELVEKILKNVQSPNLLWLRWEDCPDSSLPPWIPMNHLRVLEVTGDGLETLWQNELEAPLQLRELSIYGPLLRLPKSIGQLKHLERLKLQGEEPFAWRRGRGFTLEILPEEICDLALLKHLCLKNWWDLKCLPDSFGNLTNLEHINLSGCSSLEALPISFGKLIKLKDLVLRECTNLTLSSGSLGNISTLEYIYLTGCNSIEVLPSQIVHQLSLEELTLSNFPRLKEWPASTIGESSGLEKLVLTDIPLLETLPPSLGRDLRKLKYLELTGCGSLKRLPDSFGDLTNLEHIDLSFCISLEGLPISFGKLIKLKHLALTGCTNLTFSGGSLGNISTLEHIDLSGCTSIEVLPSQIAHQRSREALVLSNFPRLKEWPASTIGGSSGLEKLVLTDIPLLETLPPSLGRDLRKLKYLELTRCGSLKRLPGSFLLLDQLIELTVENCSLQELHFKAVDGEIETLADSGGQRTLNTCLLRLQHLKLYRTQILEVSFPTGVCPNLQQLDIEDCRDLVEVGTLPNALIKLQLKDCPKLRNIERVCGFAKLQKLDVSGCKEVEELHFKAAEAESETLTDSGGQRTVSNLEMCLLQLQYLTLHNTQISEVSFPTGVCPNLQHLNIMDCQDLVEVGTLPNALLILRLTDCPKLRNIERIYGFAKLQKLDVSGCKEVEELHFKAAEDGSETLIDSGGQRTVSNLERCLLQLQHLTLQNTQISELSFPTGACPNLQHLDIMDCQDLVEVGKLPNALIKLQLIACPKLMKTEKLCGAKLQILNIIGCVGVEELSNIETCVSLETLRLLRCLKLKSIRGLAQLTKLRELDVSECSELEELPGVEYLSSLRKMRANLCVKLKGIPGLAQLTQLRELHVYCCHGLEELREVGHLKSLEVLRASGCLKLKNIQGLEQLTQLRELDVSYCYELEVLPGVGHLRSLNILLLPHKCRKLKIIQELGELTQLKELDVYGFSKLEEMPGAGYLQPLVQSQESECVELWNEHSALPRAELQREWLTLGPPISEPATSEPAIGIRMPPEL